MKKFLLLTLLCVLIVPDFVEKLFSQQSGNKKTFTRVYIRDFEAIKENKNIAERMQNLLLTELIARGEKKFLFMDNSMTADSLDQISLNRQMGVEESAEKLNEIAQAMNFQELITTKISQEGQQFVLNLRQSVFQPRYRLKTVVSLRFYQYQMEYYTQEIAKKILNPTYKINRKKAPTLADVEIKITDLVLSDVKLGPLKLQPIKTSSQKIFSIQNNQNYGNLNVFVNTMRKFVEKADDFYSEGNYEESTETYEKILKAIATLARPKQKKLGRDVQKIKNRIVASQLLFYQREIENTDKILQEKNYEKAHDDYIKITHLIKKDKNSQNRKITTLYVLAQNRVKLSTEKRVQEIDQKVKQKKEHGTEQLISFYNQYKNLFDEYHKLASYAKSKKISSVLKNRVLALNFQIAKSIEKKGDIYREQLEFPEAEKEYLLAASNLKKRSLRTKKENRLQKKLQEKIAKNRKTGRLFLQNKISLFCSYADTEKALFLLNQSMDETETAEKNKKRAIKFLQKAKKILENNELLWENNELTWITQKSLQKYNSTAKNINEQLGQDFLYIKVDVSNFELVNTLKGHNSSVYSVDFSGDGTKIVSGSDDNTIKIWSARTGKLLNTLKGHNDSVTSVAFSPDGTKIVSGSDDNTIKIWSARTGKLLNTLKGHNKDVTSVAFSPDGTKIVSGSDDNTIKIWSARTGKLLNTLKGHNDSVTSVAFSPDGTKIVSGSGDNTIKIWSARTGKLLNTLKGHNGDVLSVDFSPDGTKIVSGSTGLRDYTIKIWSARTGKLLNTLKGHNYYVASVAFSPDGTKIVSGSGDYTIKIWSARTGKLLNTLKGHNVDVCSVDFSPDGTKIVSGSWYNIKIWAGSKRIIWVDSLFDQ